MQGTAVFGWKILFANFIFAKLHLLFCCAFSLSSGKARATTCGKASLGWCDTIQQRLIFSFASSYGFIIRKLWKGKDRSVSEGRGIRPAKPSSERWSPWEETSREAGKGERLLGSGGHGKCCVWGQGALAWGWAPLGLMKFSERSHSIIQSSSAALA